MTVEGKPVSSTILSQGTKSSSGVVLLEEELSTYVTSNSVDIAKLIEDTNSLLGKVVDALTQVVVSLSALDAVTTTPGSAAATIALVTTKNALITTANATLLLTKDNLK